MSLVFSYSRNNQTSRAGEAQGVRPESDPAPDRTDAGDRHMETVAVQTTPAIQDEPYVSKQW
jgi:hypothetical protein